MYVSLRVEVSLFVLGPEIEDRDEVEVGNWAKHKKTDVNSFFFAAVTFTNCYGIVNICVGKKKQKNNVCKTMEHNYVT
jgi:hypothetical protein